MKITKHFTWEEFTRSGTAERLHIDNTIPEALKPRIRVLCERVLEPVREQFGAIRVTSGYRCAALNARVGGAKNSQHTLGEAADIVPLRPVIQTTEGRKNLSCRNVSPMRDSSPSALNDIKGVLNDMYVWMMNNLEFDQLILEPGWIHVSYREGHNRQQVIQKRGPRSENPI